MDNLITKEDRALMAQIKQDTNAYKRLQAKARWEHISLFAVLKDYGDPRRWDLIAP